MKHLTALLLCALAASAAPPPNVIPPRINGAKVYGVHPGHPLLYRIPVSGTRPLQYAARGLPKGLTLDTATGIISGKAPAKGEYRVKLEAGNAAGRAAKDWKIVSGDTLALTPPMGWSTWYMAYEHITDKLVRDQADAMVRSGLADHGYAYVNIDDGWNIKLKTEDPRRGGPPRDAQGNLLTNKDFPDMKALTAHIHSYGLKAGIYISPGPNTCANYEGSYQHEEQDARQFVAWGFDFLKYDWCGYSKVADRKDIVQLKKPYQQMGAILAKLDRDMVFNLCQYGMGNVWEWGREVGGHFWRTTGDVGIADKKRGLWGSVEAYGFLHAGKSKYGGPGGWNDPDNILIGQILWQKKLQPTPLTPDEQYTYMSLWSLIAAPIVFGGDMTQLDEFTLQLLTNDDVLDVSQDALGRPGDRVAQIGALEVWSRDLEDGAKAVGLFNRGEQPAPVTAKWADLKLTGKRRVRDLWRREDLGVLSDQVTVTVPVHGAALLRISPPR